MGILPTGRSVSTDVIMVYRLEGGRIMEHHGQFDSAGLMQQLGGPARDLVGHAAAWYQRMDATKDLTEVLALATPDVTFRIGGQQLDRASYVGMGAMFFAAFPDGVHINDELVAVGPDRVLVKGRFVGTHTGAELQGIAPAGKKVALAYMGLMTFAADGKVCAVESQLDSAALMQQLAA
jgi:predicted ester cyclase